MVMSERIHILEEWCYGKPKHALCASFPPHCHAVPFSPWSWATLPSIGCFVCTADQWDKSVPACQWEFEHSFPPPGGAVLTCTRVLWVGDIRTQRLRPKLLSLSIHYILIAANIQKIHPCSRRTSEPKPLVVPTGASQQGWGGSNLSSMHILLCLIRELCHIGSSLLLPVSPCVCFLLLLGRRLRRRRGG